MEFKNKKISIAGFGKSGRAAAEILLERGCDVLICDEAPASKFGELPESLRGAETEFGGITDRLFEGRDLVIVSPGLSVNSRPIRRAIESGVKVIGEIEFSYLLAKAPIIGVTGTNGKSTTVSLIHKILSENGVRSILAGNIGNPLSREIADHPETDYITAEISSFQLETIDSFRPRIGMITNITSDHTDRHGGFENYAATKARMFENQTKEDMAILNMDDPACRNISKGIRSRTYWFSMEREVPDGMFAREGGIFAAEGGRSERIADVGDTGLEGRHNLQNSLAAMCAARLVGIGPEAALRSIRSYTPLHHRLERCGSIDGVDFYDDSKGTNPGAVIAAINSFDRPEALIAGGRDKGMDFGEMTSVIAEKVHTLVTIGESGPALAAACRAKGMKRVIECGRDFEAAVKSAYESVRDCGGCVLLSPAGASFDMFKSAEHRGDEFKRIVSMMEKRRGL